MGISCELKVKYWEHHQTQCASMHFSEVTFFLK